MRLGFEEHEPIGRLRFFDDAEHFPPGFIRRDSDLWQTYTGLIKSGAPMAMRKVGHRRDIYPVFRELFAKKTGAEVEA